MDNNNIKKQNAFISEEEKNIKLGRYTKRI